MNHLKLYSRNTNGSVQVWWIEQNEDSYRQHYGRLDGKIVTKGWSFAEVKNEGKVNQTTPVQQAGLEIAALYEKQKKKNYFENIENIDSGFLEPQLAKPCKDYIDDVRWENGQIVDYKLNGVCCLITKKGAFSRRNEEFFAIPHIKAELEEVFVEFPNAFFHGELFNPEYVTQLNKIAELVAVTRKEKDLTPELLAESERMVRLYLYDGYGFARIERTDNNLERRTHLESFIKSKKFKYIKCVDWKRVYSFDEMQSYFAEYVSKGGEGVIIRNPNAEYVHKRTKDLLKFKKSESDEFKVLYFEEGSADWAGAAKAVWCELPNGLKDKKFKSNLRGSLEELKRVWNNQEEYIGKFITVDYQELSPYQTPLIPYSSLLIRNYE
jgi:ATP-dependent DNA ligase